MFNNVKGPKGQKSILGAMGVEWFGLRKGTTKANLFVRTLQFVQALVVIGYYGTYLNRAMQQDKYADGKWVRTSPTSIPPEFARLMFTAQVFAVVVGSLAGITTVFTCIAVALAHFRVVAICFAWEWVMTILWAAVTGIFGSMYFSEHVEMDHDIKTMKIAAGFDAAGIILWLGSALWTTYMFIKSGHFRLHNRSGKNLQGRVPMREAR